MRNKISDFAYVSPNAILGEGNVIEEGVVIRDNVRIGDNNHISPYVTIGLAGEVRGENEIKGKVVIGDNNVIREFTSIQSPQRYDFTQIGNNCFIMDKTHIAHDCIVGDNVTIAPMVTLGGCVHVGDYTNLGINSSIHQRLIIGESCMIGMGSIVTKHISNYETWYGNPASFRGYNLVGLRKRYPDLTEDELMRLCAE
jgi:UDP-N-acetylglucosamine acyltransferase